MVNTVCFITIAKFECTPLTLKYHADEQNIKAQPRILGPRIPHPYWCEVNISEFDGRKILIFNVSCKLAEYSE